MWRKKLRMTTTNFASVVGKNAARSQIATARERRLLSAVARRLRVGWMAGWLRARARARGCSGRSRGAEAGRPPDRRFSWRSSRPRRASISRRSDCKLSLAANLASRWRKSAHQVQKAAASTASNAARNVRDATTIANCSRLSNVIKLSSCKQSRKKRAAAGRRAAPRVGRRAANRGFTCSCDRRHSSWRVVRLYASFTRFSFASSHIRPASPKNFFQRPRRNS